MVNVIQKQAEENVSDFFDANYQKKIIFMRKKMVIGILKRKKKQNVFLLNRGRKLKALFQVSFVKFVVSQPQTNVELVKQWDIVVRNTKLKTGILGIRRNVKP
jgi:hypothetical protein